jgi:DNA adenine methylase
MNNKLLPLIKWTGGKRREIKYFSKFIPKYNKYIEPFVGGGALFFNENFSDNVINDFDESLINFYNVVKNNFCDLKILIDEAKKLNGNHSGMEKKYYECRDFINSCDKKDKIANAFNFLYVNQLAFSGMRRFSKDGKFNVPFGHYKSFNPKITKNHIDLLNKTDIRNGDAISLLPTFDQNGNFIFLDPPYTRVFKKYSADSDFGEESQKNLHAVLKSMNKAKWMMIIDYSDFIKDLYKGCNIKTYSLKYGVNIKNRFNTDVEHAIITNYEIETLGKTINLMEKL